MRTVFAYLGIIVVLLVLYDALAWQDVKGGDMGNYNKLTPEEERIILGKGTEYPGTGEYLNNKADGVYSCKRCDAPLYRSADKFDSGCGWPSFDDEIPGAVKRVPDVDGRRTEITCAACGGHLGHVFTGERFTAKDTRHCVNSLSLKFRPAGEAAAASGAKTAYFAAGCFWGVEYWFRREPGVESTQVGYMGGGLEKPTYRQVCGGDTGHVEALRVTYDPAKTDYETLCRLFFEIHDFTQANGQGPDIGSQYLSAIFAVDGEQQAVAEKLVGELAAKGKRPVTKIIPATGVPFWPAEDYHQDYYGKNGQLPYCHTRRKVF